MIKYAVKYLKNVFVPLKGVNLEEDGDNCSSLLDDKLVLVRTDKGEEVLKAFRVCSKIAEKFEQSQKTPEIGRAHV